jgi:hypothetical protein
MVGLPRRRPVVRSAFACFLRCVLRAASSHALTRRCYDAQSCTARLLGAPSLTSSQFPDGNPRWASNLTQSGIFSTDAARNPWAGANLIQIGYCSSDAWVGDIAADDVALLANVRNTAGRTGWAFKGQRIVAATIAALVAHNGFGSVPGTRLLFGGCSAGARGAMFSLDYIQAMLPAGVELRGFLDSPLWIDTAPLSAATASLQAQTEAVYALVNATARLGGACVAAYPSSSDQWRCLFGQYRMPFLRVPYLLSASQFDRYQLPYDLDAWPPYDAPQLAYAAGFQADVRAIVLTLPDAAQPRSAVFSSACFKHCTSNLDAFWGVRVGALNLKDYLSLWYFGTDAPHAGAAIAAAGASAGLPAGVATRHIEDCTGFGCGQCHNRSAGGAEGAAQPAAAAPVAAPAAQAAWAAAPPPPPPAPAQRAVSLGRTAGVLAAVSLLLCVVAGALRAAWRFLAARAGGGAQRPASRWDGEQIRIVSSSSFSEHTPLVDLAGACQRASAAALDAMRSRARGRS